MPYLLAKDEQATTDEIDPARRSNLMDTWTCTANGPSVAFYVIYKYFTNFI